MREENIKALSEKDKVRKRISVWLGASNHIAVFHTLKELLGNSMDEISKGNGNKIEVIRHNEKKITVKDNCKGLPLEGKNDEGVENYKLLLEQLFAGTKYDNGIENEDYVIGVNGVGLTTTVYASKDIYIEVGRPNGNVYSTSYHKGDLVSPLKVIGKTEETYTSITYELDDEVFEENYFTDEEISLLSEEQSSLIDGEITFKDEVTGIESVFDVKDIGCLLDIRTKKEAFIGERIEFSHGASFTVPKSHDGSVRDVVDKVKMDVAIQFSKEDSNVQIEFLNSSNLLHHGTIQDGLLSGMRNIFNRHLKSINAYNKKESQITKDDVSIGMNYIIDFKSFFPVYANQTKFATYVKYYETVVRESLDSFFETYVLENKHNMDIIAKTILVNKRSREKAESTRLDIKKKLGGSISGIANKIDGYLPAKSKDKSKNILLICEGKSALSSVISGRQEYHAVLALRGKVLNCLKASMTTITKNEVIMNLMKIIGGGINTDKKKDFDIENINFDKIYICCDQDGDGTASILPLLLTAFLRLAPELILEGKVFLTETPYYEIIFDDDSEDVYAVDDEELEEIKKKYKDKKFDINRIKGLAELSKEAMAMSLHPDYSRHLQIRMDNYDESLNTFDLFMGKDIESRKKIILDSFDEIDGIEIGED